MSPEKIVKQVSELVSLPFVVVKINEQLDDNTSSATDIGELIIQDPGLASKVLRIANSAFYGLSYQVDTISRAVTLLGTQQLRNIVVAAACVDVFKKLPNRLMTMEDFWRHSLYCGLVSRALGGLCGFRNSEGLFIGGLLHDVGVLAMFRLQPDLSRQALEINLDGSQGDPEIHEAEQRVFGFDHADVGAALLNRWKFPEKLTQIVARHHYPERAGEFAKEASIVHIANSISVLAELDTDDLEFAPAISEFAWQTTGLSPERIGGIREQADAQFQDSLATFLPGTDGWPRELRQGAA